MMVLLSMEGGAIIESPHFQGAAAGGSGDGVNQGSQLRQQLTPLHFELLLRRCAHQQIRSVQMTLLPMRQQVEQQPFGSQMVVQFEAAAAGRAPEARAATVS